MPVVPGLRSCYAKVGRLCYVGRMFDKIRLHAAGRLHADYHGNLGVGFDGRACTFLSISHRDLVARVKQGGTDDEILAWCHEHGGPRTDEECNIWNRFMMKIGWRDDRTLGLQQRIVEYGLTGHRQPIETFFDLFDYDEGRDPVASQPWLG